MYFTPFFICSKLQLYPLKYKVKLFLYIFFIYIFYIYYIYMGGGLIQLVAMGAQDVFLTGNPQITFFKIVY